MPPWPSPAVAAFFDEHSHNQKLKLSYTLCKITRYFLPLQKVSKQHTSKFFSNGKGGICETDNSPNERLFRIDMVLTEESTKQCLTDKVHFTFLQLPAFEKDEQQCETDFERWIYILNHMETFNRMPFLAQSAVFKKLAEISDISTLSKEEHEKYDESIKNYRDTMAAFKEARAEGQSEAKREIARNLLKDAIPFSTIAAWTGLTEEEIAQLNAECDA